MNFEVAASKFNIDHHLTSTISKGPSENFKKMSWDNPVSPIDAKNSIVLFVQFFWGQPGLVGDSDHSGQLPHLTQMTQHSTIMISKQTNHCQLGNLKFMKQTYCLLGSPSSGPKPMYNSTFVFSFLGLGYEAYFGRSKYQRVVPKICDKAKYHYKKCIIIK